MIDKRTKTDIYVKNVKYSPVTGKVRANQKSNSCFLWSPVQLSHNERVGNSVPYSEVAVRVEPFDMKSLSIIEIKKQIIDLDVSINSMTIGEYIEEIKNVITDRGIPEDAIINDLEGDTIQVTYERLETLQERTVRLYRIPKRNDLEKIKIIEKCEEDIKNKEKELLEIRDKIKAARGETF